ncbi:MAG: hypothetical protein ABJB12_15050 [Pseudomonadota bacterium]
MKRSLLDLPPPPSRLRAAFFFGYLCVQLGLLLRAQASPDFVFGFQMFNASSELKIALFRKVRRKRLLRVTDGTWRVTGADGGSHTYRWGDRVHDGVLSTLDRYVHASYGLDAQLFRLQFALNDVAAHLPDDHETQEIVALVDTRKNGREGPQVRLTGVRRE